MRLGAAQHEPVGGAALGARFHMCSVQQGGRGSGASRSKSTVATTTACWRGGITATGIATTAATLSASKASRAAATVTAFVASSPVST